MLLTLAEVLGPVATATARCQSSMRRVADLYQEMNLKMATRTEAGRVGTQNVTEAEIQRRQVTRIGAQANLVGTENATERAMRWAILDALVGEALRGVGSINPTQAEIYRRVASAYINLPKALR